MQHYVEPCKAHAHQFLNKWNMQKISEVKCETHVDCNPNLYWPVGGRIWIAKLVNSEAYLIQSPWLDCGQGSESLVTDEV
jgi:hypothetical protein